MIKKWLTDGATLSIFGKMPNVLPPYMLRTCSTISERRCLFNPSLGRGCALAHFVALAACTGAMGEYRSGKKKPQTRQGKAPFSGGGRNTTVVIVVILPVTAITAAIPTSAMGALASGVSIFVLHGIYVATRPFAECDGPCFFRIVYIEADLSRYSMHPIVL